MMTNEEEEEEEEDGGAIQCPSVQFRQPRASEAGVCRGSDTPNYLCGGDIDMYIPP